MVKKCYKCKKLKSLDEFHKCSSKKDGRQDVCKECKKEYRNSEHGRKVRRAYEERFKDRRRELDLLRFRGISIEQYNSMFEKQKGLCAICNRPERKTKKDGTLYNLSVDHDHETGEIRKLLCYACNLAIGQFDEDIVILKSAINYLKKYKK